MYFANTVACVGQLALGCFLLTGAPVYLLPVILAVVAVVSIQLIESAVQS